jgi:NitT/TauT family transport system ATP-binding protein
MRQRVALIRTLVTNPDILLLDEPFSSLDFQTRLTLADEVFNIIKDQGKTAVLVTHDIPEAISMGDRVMVMSKRPSTISSIYNIQLEGEMTPMQKRSTGAFNLYFNDIWKELESHVTAVP